MTDGAAHAHGMDCCWECFAGNPTHPDEPDDWTCRDREGWETGRCLYAKDPDTSETEPA